MKFVFASALYIELWNYDLLLQIINIITLPSSFHVKLYAVFLTLLTLCCLECTQLIVPSIFQLFNPRKSWCYELHNEATRRCCRSDQSVEPATLPANVQDCAMHCGGQHVRVQAQRDDLGDRQ